MSATRDDLNQFFERLLDVGQFADYGPNGLQVEGTELIDRIAFAVSATVHSIQEAADRGAQALVVHHGLFWSFHGPRTLTGPFARRVFPLVRHNINLFCTIFPWMRIWK
jgi:putative NIF3 family GTP cyclohydrolase 1 type 2